MKKCVLSVRSLSIASEVEQLLENISFDLYEGDVLGVVGINGVGKTLLARMLCGWQRPDSGDIRLDGQIITAHGDRESTFAGIGYVSESPEVLPNLTVAENLFLGSNEHAGVFARRTRMQRMAAAVFAEYRFRLPPSALAESLTMAQRTMLQIARQLLRRPRVLVVDDLAGSFSENELENLHQVINDYVAEGGSVIHTSHNYSELMRFATRMLVLRNNSLVAELERTDFDKRLLRNILYDPSSLAPDISAGLYRERYRGGTKLLRLEDWSAGQVRGLSFTLHKREIIGVVGVTGSGKSDVIRGLGGFIPASGRLLLQGEPVSISSPASALRLGISTCLESRESMLLSENDSILINTTLGVLDRVSRGPFLSRKRERLLATEVCQQLELPRDVSQRLGQLNNASLFKVALARCIASNPRILLLDEPNREVDRKGVRELCDVIERLRERCSILITFSKLDDMADICDRVLLLHDGRPVTWMDKGSLTYDRMMNLIIAKGWTNDA